MGKCARKRLGKNNDPRKAQGSIRKIMKYLFYFLPFAVGIALTTQAGINSQLKVAINNPWMAAFISFVTGTAFLAIVLIVTRQTIPSAPQLASIPLYKYTGGILGAFIVTAVIFS